MNPETNVLSIAHGPDLSSEPGLGELTLPGFLRTVCRTHGPREALCFREGDAPVLRLSYDDLWMQATALARVLAAQGVGKESRIGLLATNRPEWVVTMFGIVLAGGTCVALSSFATRDELEQQLRLADVSLLFFERSIGSRDYAADLLALCPELAKAGPGQLRSPRLPYLRHVVCLESSHEAVGIESLGTFLARPTAFDAAFLDAIVAQIAPSDRALVFFSSGSTGKPKAILQTHRAAAIQCWRWARMFGLGDDVRTWAANGFFWSGNFAMAVGATLASGGSLVLQRMFDAGEALKLMEAEKVTKLIAWPHQWAKLTAEPGYAGADLSALHYVPNNSPLRQHPTVKTDWDEPFSAYGNTETLTISAAHASGTPAAIREGNHGFPLPGNTFRILDPMTGAIVPRGQAGEIAVKGPTLMLGYLKTAPEGVFDEDGFFRTGDGGFLDEQGRLHWQGRLNDIIKTGGANVSPQEIDLVLLECPGVKLAKTVGVPHETLGEMVVACVVPQPGAAVDEAAVRAFVGRKLSSYKVPRRVLLLGEGDMALTGTNKVKTAELRELAVKRLKQ
ncbi:MAG TPA: class I adenylate-forming enzyme family protein [Nevskiaceae bacterium]|nr:class I adenylate-forming enzyme family protein [Nevskiaceae bacterium]